MIYLRQPKKFAPRFEAVGCFLESDGNILLLHRHNHKPEGGSWGMPAGKVGNRETTQRAMLRELFQETGLRVSPEDLNYFRKVFVRYPKYDFVYHIYHVSFNKKPTVRINSNEHQGFKWVRPLMAIEMDLIEDFDACIKLFYNT